MSQIESLRLPAGGRCSRRSLGRVAAVLVAAAFWLPASQGLAQQPGVNWRYTGEFVDVDLAGGPDIVTPFDVSGTNGNAVQTEVGTNSRAKFTPNASVDFSALTLKSGATIEAAVDNWVSLSALGQVSALYSDRTTVRGGGSAAGFIEFTWKNNGTLSASALSTNAEFGNLQLGYSANAELFAFVDAGADVIRESIAKYNISRGQLTPAELNCTRAIVDSGPTMRLEAPTFEFKDQRDLTGSGVQSQYVVVPFQDGTPVDLTVGLATCASFRADSLDIGPVDIRVAAEFQKSATLTAVRVLDENMQPLTEPFEFISENGYVYPLHQVPEPSGGLLALVAAACCAAARLRRRAAR